MDVLLWMICSWCCVTDNERRKLVKCVNQRVVRILFSSNLHVPVDARTFDVRNRSNDQAPQSVTRLLLTVAVRDKRVGMCTRYRTVVYVRRTSHSVSDWCRNTTRNYKGKRFGLKNDVRPLADSGSFSIPSIACKWDLRPIEVELLLFSKKVVEKYRS